MKKRGIQTFALACLAVSTTLPSAWACGLEGGPGDAFSIAYDGSLNVAFAARDAMHGGWLLPDPELATEHAHDRADQRLMAFAAALPAAARLSRPFAVLLVEPGVWTRVTPKAGRWALAAHVDKPEEGETVVLASEIALRNLNNGQLSASKALASGVLVVRGEARERERLIATLRQTYPDQTAQMALR